MFHRLPQWLLELHYTEHFQACYRKSHYVVGHRLHPQSQDGIVWMICRELIMIVWGDYLHVFICLYVIITEHLSFFAYDLIYLPYNLSNIIFVILYFFRKALLLLLSLQGNALALFFYYFCFVLFVSYWQCVFLE